MIDWLEVGVALVEVTSLVILIVDRGVASAGGGEVVGGD